MRKAIDVRGWVFATILATCGAMSPSLVASDIPGGSFASPLERGFAGLYNLDFADAQQDFAAWQWMHLEDPMGPVSEAAGILFSEFNRLGVLEAQFYENDDAFSKRPKLSPDPSVRAHFDDAITRTENLAHSKLAKDPKDREALFAMTLSSGWQADYAALIEKRNLVSLRFTKRASVSAQELLTVCPDCYDALLATGVQQVHHWQHGVAVAVDLAHGRSSGR